jgi:hypothetical protein
MEKALYARRAEEDWRFAFAVHAGQSRDHMQRANLLLVGAERPVQDILNLVQRECVQPVATWCPEKPLVLPPVDQAKTMILRDVGRLSPADQRRLLDWLDKASGRTQIVSTAPEPLLASVQAGALSSALYYRLNTLYVEVGN